MDRKLFNWNDEKNSKLIKERGISFDEIVYCIQNKKIIGIVKKSNYKKYPDQKIFLIPINNYVYLVPFVENKNEIFLKTIIPSSKATKIYLGGKK